MYKSLQKRLFNNLDAREIIKFKNIQTIENHGKRHWQDKQEFNDRHSCKN